MPHPQTLLLGNHAQRCLRPQQSARGLQKAGHASCLRKRVGLCQWFYYAAPTSSMKYDEVWLQCLQMSSDVFGCLNFFQKEFPTHTASGQLPLHDLAAKSWLRMSTSQGLVPRVTQSH